MSSDNARAIDLIPTTDEQEALEESLIETLRNLPETERKRVESAIWGDPPEQPKCALDLDALEKAARKANQEPWRYFDREVYAPGIGSVAELYGPLDT
jgi:hypothetical protein